MFHTNFWGDETIKSLHDVDLGNLGGQIKSTMLVTLWSFIGIEGAVVISDRAESQAAVSKATLIGFLLCWLSYVAISMLPFGTLSQGELSVLAPPSSASILADIVGKWGSWFMNAGVIIAVSYTHLILTFACGGAQNIINFSAEAKDPTKDMPFVIIVSTAVVAIFYAFMAIVATGILPIGDVMGQPLSLVASKILPDVYKRQG